jgi:hypothetical protein
MAEYLSIAEAKTYELTNGTDVDLVALIGTGTPEGWVHPESLFELAVGQIAYVGAMGSMRRGVVTKIGRTKVTVSFTTQGSVDEAIRFYGGAKGVRVQSTNAGLTEVRIAPAPTMQESVERVIASQATVREDEHGKVHYIPAAAPEVLAPVEALDGPDPQAPAAPATGSTVVEALERVWDVIRSNHPELPVVVIVTGAGVQPAGLKWGHFRANGWTHREHEVQAEGAATNLRLGEMFVAGETLAHGAKHTVETMLHEATHVLAKVRGIQDTSRQNRWHNQKFRTLAGELGMEYNHPQADPKIGFSEVTFAPGTQEDYEQVIAQLDAAIRLTIDLPSWLGGKAGQGLIGPGSGGEHTRKPKAEGDEPKSSNYVKAVCGCRDDKGKPEFVIRIAKTKLARAEIQCTICGEFFGSPEDES